MIRASYRQEEGAHELTVNGHAGYAPYGQDIVCAGVSALVYALLMWLEHNQEDITRLDEVIAQEGRVYIRCTGSHRLNTVFQMTVLGLQAVARMYPRHLTVEGDGEEA